MAKLSMIIGGAVFDCDGGEDFVRAERERFMSAVIPEEAQDESEIEKGSTPFAVAPRMIRVYDLPSLFQALQHKYPLNIGDSFMCEMLNGRVEEFVVTAEDDEAYRFESRDCLGEYVTHDKVEEFFSHVFNLLPSALSAAIIDTERKYLDENGKECTQICKLFLPAAPEIFPPDECYGDNGLYEQMDWYKDCHNRIRALSRGDGTSDWYWTASRLSGYTTNWCYVDYYGSASDNDASYTYIAAPVCFRIRKS